MQSVGEQGFIPPSSKGRGGSCEKLPIALRARTSSSLVAILPTLGQCCQEKTHAVGTTSLKPSPTPSNP
ncbi:hypothetical protein VTI28DRAFT_2159 [Corynascus sepedonium]